MNDVQTALLEMMVDVDKVLKANDVMYFLDSGNAIGAVRHKGFIPWDDDIDIVIKRKDVKKFVKAIKGMKGYHLQCPHDKDWLYNYYKIRKDGTTAIEEEWKDCDIHHGLFIDVFVMEDYPDSPTARKIYDDLVDHMDNLGGLHHSYRGLPRQRIVFVITWVMIKSYNIILDLITKKNCEYVTQRTNFRKVKTYPKKFIESTIDFDYEGVKLPLCNGYDEVLRIQFGDYMQLPPVEQRSHSHISFFSKDMDYREYFKMLKKNNGS